MFLKVSIASIVFIISTALFYFASGSLSVRKLSMVSVTYYEFMVMVFAGSVLCFLGFGRGHYIIGSLDESLLERVFAVVAASGIAMPAIMLLLNVVLGVKDAPRQVNRFYDLPTAMNINQLKLYRFLAISTAIGILCTLYTFFTLRSIPLLDVIRFGSSNSASIRWSARNEFGGNTYIRNIGMLTLVPLNSMATHIASRIMSGRKWKRLAAIAVVAAFFALTWNLEKAPIVFHFLYLYIIGRMTDGENKEARVRFLPYLVAGAFFLLIGYYITSGSLPELSLSSGPLGRIFMTTNGTLALHYYYFPNYYPFLKGSSLPTVIARLIGLNSGWQRSGAIVMSLFNPRGIEAHTAGVMNAFFIGEAYANWGVIGSVISVIVVAIFVGLSNSIILRSKKTFLTILCTTILIKFQVTSMLGGIVDYIYSISLIFSLAYAYVVYSTCREQVHEGVAETPRGHLRDRRRLGG